MALGEKLRQARLEAGLSQQALCNGEITRNMKTERLAHPCGPCNTWHPGSENP